ncbi:MAG TPA: hypothetical protein VFE53_01220 [Mucilaginibacter sp.]|jgi:hypothetical protein|nr:hypothetical protein [Mucilaginibacter sp.]
MKNKRILLFLLALVAIASSVNSCKKQSQSAIEQLFTGGYWELASVTATYYTGNTVDSTAALNTDTVCQAGQKFTFYTNNTCTYTNFDCLTQTSPAASWSLTGNQLYLQANVVCKDTTKKGSSMPFAYAQIENLGQFSLVLNIGDIQPNYSLTQKRVIYQYGFIRQVPTTGN